MDGISEFDGAMASDHRQKRRALLEKVPQVDREYGYDKRRRTEHEQAMAQMAMLHEEMHKINSGAFLTKTMCQSRLKDLKRHDVFQEGQNNISRLMVLNSSQKKELNVANREDGKVALKITEEKRILHTGDPTNRIACGHLYMLPDSGGTTWIPYPGRPETHSLCFLPSSKFLDMTKHSFAGEGTLVLLQQTPKCAKDEEGEFMVRMVEYATHSQSGAEGHLYCRKDANEPWKRHPGTAPVVLNQDTTFLENAEVEGISGNVKHQEMEGRLVSVNCDARPLKGHSWESWLQATLPTGRVIKNDATKRCYSVEFLVRGCQIGSHHPAEKQSATFLLPYDAVTVADQSATPTVVEEKSSVDGVHLHRPKVGTKTEFKRKIQVAKNVEANISLFGKILGYTTRGTNGKEEDVIKMQLDEEDESMVALIPRANRSEFDILRVLSDAQRVQNRREDIDALVKLKDLKKAKKAGDADVKLQKLVLALVAIRNKSLPKDSTYLGGSCVLSAVLVDHKAQSLSFSIPFEGRKPIILNVKSADVQPLPGQPAPNNDPSLLSCLEAPPVGKSYLSTLSFPGKTKADPCEEVRDVRCRVEANEAHHVRLRLLQVPGNCIVRLAADCFAVQRPLAEEELAAEDGELEQILVLNALPQKGLVPAGTTVRLVDSLPKKKPALAQLYDLAASQAVHARIVEDVMDGRGATFSLIADFPHGQYREKHGLSRALLGKYVVLDTHPETNASPTPEKDKLVQILTGDNAGRKGMVIAATHNTVSVNLGNSEELTLPAGDVWMLFPDDSEEEKAEMSKLGFCAEDEDSSSSDSESNE